MSSYERKFIEKEKDKIGEENSQLIHQITTTGTHAIHDNVDNEITAVALKAVPHADDELLIEDSEAFYVKKSITVGTLPFEAPIGSKGSAFNKNFGTLGTEVCVGNDSRLSDDRNDPDAIHKDIANEITAITPKTTPVDADEFVIEDSEASFVKKALTFADLKTAIGIIQHAMDNATYHTSSDITTLNATSSKHGFLPKLSNIVTEFLNGQGGWTTPPSGDANAIHADVDGEIVVITEKTVPTIADEVIIEDADASNAKKSVKLGNIDIDGNVTGKLSATVVANDSHTHNTQYYTEAEMNAFLSIGTVNKRYVSMILDGGFRIEEDLMDYALANHGNRSGLEMELYFQIALPLTMGSLHLHVDEIRMYQFDADASNRIHGCTVYGKSDATTTSLYSDTTLRSSTGIITLNTGIDDWGDYRTVRFGLDITCTTQLAWELTQIQARCWYA